MAALIKLNGYVEGTLTEWDFERSNNHLILNEPQITRNDLKIQSSNKYFCSWVEEREYKQFSLILPPK